MESGEFKRIKVRGNREGSSRRVMPKAGLSPGRLEGWQPRRLGASCQKLR